MPAFQALSLSRMYTQLLGRDVTFTLAPKVHSSSAPSLYGIYRCGAGESVMLVKADLTLMASIGGVLVGLPEEIAYARVQLDPLDELLRDAIHEVLNITSTPLSVGYRVVFESLHLHESQLTQQGRTLLAAGVTPVSFAVAIKGHAGGLFQVTKPD